MRRRHDDLDREDNQRREITRIRRRVRVDMDADHGEEEPRRERNNARHRALARMVHGPDKPRARIAREPPRGRPREVPGSETIGSMLRLIEDARSLVEERVTKLFAYLTQPDEMDEADDHERRQLAWKEFQAAGGATADDWDRWLKGELIGPHGPVIAKKHLRLVARTRAPRVRLRRLTKIDDDGPRTA